MKRTWAAYGAAAAMLAMAAPVSAQDASLGDLVTGGMTKICVPIIERGESLNETAVAEGFVEVSDDDKAAMGAPADVSWWASQSTEAFLMAGRNLSEAGAPCWILASASLARSDGIDETITDWLDDHRSGFDLVRTPQPSDGPDPLWVWERVGGGTVQQLQINVTDHQDGTATAVARYSLLPQRR